MNPVHDKVGYKCMYVPLYPYDSVTFPSTNKNTHCYRQGLNNKFLLLSHSSSLSNSDTPAYFTHNTPSTTNAQPRWLTSYLVGSQTYQQYNKPSTKQYKYMPLNQDPLFKYEHQALDEYPSIHAEVYKVVKEVDTYFNDYVDAVNLGFSYDLSEEVKGEKEEEENEEAVASTPAITFPPLTRQDGCISNEPSLQSTSASSSSSSTTDDDPDVQIISSTSLSSSSSSSSTSARGVSDSEACMDPLIYVRDFVPAPRTLEGSFVPTSSLLLDPAYTYSTPLFSRRRRKLIVGRHSYRYDYTINRRRNIIIDPDTVLSNAPTPKQLEIMKERKRKARTSIEEVGKYVYFHLDHKYGHRKAYTIPSIRDMFLVLKESIVAARKYHVNYGDKTIEEITLAFYWKCSESYQMTSLKTRPSNIHCYPPSILPDYSSDLSSPSISQSGFSKLTKELRGIIFSFLTINERCEIIPLISKASIFRLPCIFDNDTRTQFPIHYARFRTMATEPDDLDTYFSSPEYKTVSKVPDANESESDSEEEEARDLEADATYGWRTAMVDGNVVAIEMSKEECQERRINDDEEQEWLYLRRINTDYDVLSLPIHRLDLVCHPILSQYINKCFILEPAPAQEEVHTVYCKESKAYLATMYMMPLFNVFHPHNNKMNVAATRSRTILFQTQKATPPLSSPPYNIFVLDLDMLEDCATSRKAIRALAFIGSYPANFISVHIPDKYAQPNYTGEGIFPHLQHLIIGAGVFFNFKTVNSQSFSPLLKRLVGMKNDVNNTLTHLTYQPISLGLDSFLMFTNCRLAGLTHLCLPYIHMQADHSPHRIASITQANLPALTHLIIDQDEHKPGASAPVYYTTMARFGFIKYISVICKNNKLELKLFAALANYISNNPAPQTLKTEFVYFQRANGWTQLVSANACQFQVLDINSASKVCYGWQGGKERIAPVESLLIEFSKIVERAMIFMNKPIPVVVATKTDKIDVKSDDCERMEDEREQGVSSVTGSEMEGVTGLDAE